MRLPQLLPEGVYNDGHGVFFILKWGVGFRAAGFYQLAVAGQQTKVVHDVLPDACEKTGKLVRRHIGDRRLILERHLRNQSGNRLFDGLRFARWPILRIRTRAVGSSGGGRPPP